MIDNEKLSKQQRINQKSAHAVGKVRLYGLLMDIKLVKLSLIIMIPNYNLSLPYEFATFFKCEFSIFSLIKKNKKVTSAVIN